LPLVIHQHKFSIYFSLFGLHITFVFLTSSCQTVVTGDRIQVIQSYAVWRKLIFNSNCQLVCVRAVN